VKGSTDLAERVDPEQWHAVLDRFFQILADGVHRFEGTVNQYTGDGIMALFGAPIAHEDHAQRACYAALYLRDQLREFGQELRREHGLDFSTRVGLNSGEVIGGKIGDDLRMDYTAQGHTVMLADRMQQLAEAGKVYLAEQTARLVKGYFQLEDLGEFRVKGVASAIPVYGLEGVGELRTRLDVSRARGFARFVGRADEMATVELALHRAEGGDGQVVGVVGEAGIGKSRLCLEFVERCRSKGTPVYEAHCPAHGKTVPLLPILELLRSAFGITAQDRDQVARDKIAGRLLLLDEAFRADIPLVFDFLGVPDPERPAPQVEPEARQRQLSSFLRRLVQARSERETAVLLFDDLHWIDADGNALLAQLVEAAGGTRTLLLVNFRPEYRAEWVGKSYYQQLPLSPLGPEAIRELLRELLGDDPSVSDLPDLIRERTGGNPFFIEEVVQSLIEGGHLEGARGSYRLVRPIGALEIPTTVQPMLAARIDRLAEREKQVLQAAAVIGKTFPEAVIARVAELPEPDLAAALSHLRDAEFIYEATLYPEVEYAFKHPLTQEVAYDSQLSGRRKQVHAAVARALEELHPDSLDEQAALLAEHWERAGDAIQAVAWHYRAALWASRSGGPAESLRRGRRMLSLLEDVPESEASLDALLNACGSILGWGGVVGIPRDEADAVFERAKAAAEALGDPIRGALMGFYYAGAARLDPVSHLQIIEEGWAVVGGGDDPGARLMLGLMRAGALSGLGRQREAYDQTRRLTADPPEDLGIGSQWHGGQSPFLALLIFEGGLTAVMGQPARGLARLEEGIEQAERRGELPTCREAAYGAALACFFLGDAAGTMAWAERCRALAEREGSLWAPVQANQALWWANNLARDWPEMLRVAERRLELQKPPLPITRAMLATSQARVGEVQRARELATEVLAEAPAGQLWLLGEALVASAVALILAGAVEERDQIEAALDAYDVWSERSGVSGALPIVHTTRAAFARLLGDEERCERECAEVRRLATEMGATGWVDWCARNLAELETSSGGPV
jgi:class 3 adenylate cyclase